MWGGRGNGSGHSLLALSQNSPVLPPAFTSWDNLRVCALPQPREARRTWLALALLLPIPVKIIKATSNF